MLATVPFGLCPWQEVLLGDGGVLSTRYPMVAWGSSSMVENKVCWWSSSQRSMSMRWAKHLQAGAWVGRYKRWLTGGLPSRVSTQAPGRVSVLAVASVRKICSA